MSYKLEPGTFKYSNGRRIRVVYLINTLGGNHYRSISRNSLRCKCRYALKDTLEFRDNAVRAPELRECIHLSLSIRFLDSYREVAPKPLGKDN